MEEARTRHEMDVQALTDAHAQAINEYQTRHKQHMHEIKTDLPRNQCAGRWDARSVTVLDR